MASAKGTLHLEWRHGAVSAAVSAQVPQALARFDRWAADAEIAGGAVTLKQNQVQRGARKAAVEAAVAFAASPKVVFAAPKEAKAKR